AGGGAAGAVRTCKLPDDTRSTAPANRIVRMTVYLMGSSPGQNASVAPSRARRPDGKARRRRMSGTFDGGATQSAGMHRPANAAGILPRTAWLRLRAAGILFLAVVAAAAAA